MKHAIILILIFIFGYEISAQDIDIYSLKKNSNFELPVIDQETSFEEFQLLNRTLRMQDMVIAAVVPGYVHFKVKEPTIGYSMLAARSVGYIGMYYVLSDNTFSLVNLINNKQPASSNTDAFNKQKRITYASLGLIFGSYLFDWIHGRERLEKKQELIRYKYSMKLNISYLESPNNGNIAFPAIGLRYSF